MGRSSLYRLSSAPLSLRILVTSLVLALSLGYFVSFLQIKGRTKGDFRGVVEHYRGSGVEEGIAVPQSDGTMISVAHVHTLSQPVVIGLMGFLLVLTSVSEGAKAFWILATFLGSVASNLSPWLIRDVSPRFVLLLYLSGFAMFAGFFVIAFFVLTETWRKG